MEGEGGGLGARFWRCLGDSYARGRQAEAPAVARLGPTRRRGTAAPWPCPAPQPCPGSRPGSAPQPGPAPLSSLVPRLGPAPLSMVDCGPVRHPGQPRQPCRARHRSPMPDTASAFGQSRGSRTCPVHTSRPIGRLNACHRNRSGSGAARRANKWNILRVGGADYPPHKRPLPEMPEPYIKAFPAYRLSVRGCLAIRTVHPHLGQKLTGQNTANWTENGATSALSGLRETRQAPEREPRGAVLRDAGGARRRRRRLKRRVPWGGGGGRGLAFGDECGLAGSVL